MSTKLHDRIRSIREEQGKKQAEIAAAIGLSRLTYINIESGEKNPTIDQFISICRALSVKPRQVLFPGEDGTSENVSQSKYRQMCLACIEYGSDKHDKKITKTKLAKLLYLVDFSWLRGQGNGSPMSGVSYIRLPRGPVADVYLQMIDDMFENGQILVQTKGAAQMISANEGQFGQSLTESELNHIKAVCERWQNVDTQTIVEFTHEQAPWSLTEPGKIISYELARQIPEDRLY